MLAASSNSIIPHGTTSRPLAAPKSHLAIGMQTAVGSHPFINRSSLVQPAEAFVRQGLAAEYHTCDFDWEEWKQEAEPIVKKQAQEGQALLAAATTSEPLNQPATPVIPSVDEPEAWEEFYAGTARSAKFFRERRYLLLEFPVLAQQQPMHVVELGCGAGASLLPVLRTNPDAQVTATDIAPTCITQLREVAEREAIPNHSQRITAFVADSASPAALPQFQGLGADVALIMFTLSAVPPEGQAHMLRNAWEALRPGGLLCIRDHGLYDMVQLRIPSNQWMGDNMYKRGDGTLAFFFSTQDLSAKASAAGFEVHECEYVTVINRNRKSGTALRRVFVHGVFKKPGSDM